MPTRQNVEYPVLAAAIAARGISFAELANQTGIGRSSLSALVSGRSYAGAGRRQRIADALDMSENDLFSREIPTVLAPLKAVK